MHFKGTNPPSRFSAVGAGSTNALFIGGLSGHRFRGLLPSDGDVSVRLHLTRAAARRDASSSCCLRLGLSGTPFHPSSHIPRGFGPVLTRQVSVIRRAKQSATVVLTTPVGQKRPVLFIQGKAVASDQPDTLSERRRGDVSVVTLGDNLERYAIAMALVLGGCSRFRSPSRPLPSVMVRFFV